MRNQQSNNHKDSIVIILLSFFLTTVTMAVPTKNTPANQLIYGPEWTFTNEKAEIGHFEFIDLFQNIYSELKLRNEKNKYFSKIEIDSSNAIYVNQSQTISLTTLDGIKIQITQDPGVVEVQVSPMSLKTWIQKSTFFQKNIFDLMKVFGLQPHEREGAGHLNIGLSYFVDKPNLVEKFILDYLNHPGVGVVLNSLTANKEDAPSVIQYLEKKELLGIYKNNFIETANNFNLLKDSKLESKPYEITLLSYLSEKFTGLGVREIDFTYFANGIGPISRLELRQLRPQKSMKNYIQVIEIFEARIRYLEKQRQRSKLRVNSISNGWVFLGQYADYIEEAGLDAQKYKDLMPSVWRDLPESNYIRKFKKTVNKCINLF